MEFCRTSAFSMRRNVKGAKNIFIRTASVKLPKKLFDLIISNFKC